MTAGEVTLVLATSLLGAAFAGWRAASLAEPHWRIVVAGLIGLDLIGGAVCNATATTRDWYHRRGQGALQHVVFVVPHLAYVVVLAAWFRGGEFDTRFAVVIGLALLASAGGVLAVSPRLRLPVAFLSLLVAVGLDVELTLTPGVEWFTPALFLKLIVGHLPGGPARDGASP